jgi:DNA-binding transcriptional regulator YiaG
MQRYELIDWLGDNQGDLTDDQVTELLATANAIEDQYPDADDQDEAQAALTAEYRLMVENNAELIDDLANNLMRARIAQAEALAGIQQVARTVVTTGEISENEFARMAGVDRMTVRKWLGKR